MRLYSVGFYTLGCKVSQYETEAIREGFRDAGFDVRSFEEKNDAYVINTCTVTSQSDSKSRKIIRRAIKQNPDAVIAVVGCYSQLSPDEVAAISGVDIVIGTDGKMAVVDLVKEMLEAESREQIVSVSDVNTCGFEPMSIKEAERTRVYLKIEDGCESRCTYCAISKARGRVRSKPKDEVISEVEALSASGVKEIVLTGIETGSYGRDFYADYGLADLICELDGRGSCEVIRLGSLAPELVGKSFVDKIRDVKILAPHFHLSLQSGSDSVLARMKRRYTRGMAIENVKRIRDAFPKATFTTDLMVGFPGESEADFLETVSFVHEIGLLDAHVFAYSRRRGTEADKFDRQIPECEKAKRSELLIREKNKSRDRILEGIVNSGDSLIAVMETEIDGVGYAAHSDTYVELVVKTELQNLRGERIEVKPVSHKDGIVYAEPIR